MKCYFIQEYFTKKNLKNSNKAAIFCIKDKLIYSAICMWVLVYTRKYLQFRILRKLVRSDTTGIIASHPNNKENIFCIPKCRSYLNQMILKLSPK